MKNRGVLIKDMPDGPKKRIAEKLIRDFLEELSKEPSPKWSDLNFKIGDVISARTADQSKVVLFSSCGIEEGDIASAEQAGIEEPIFGYAGTWFLDYFPDGLVVKDAFAGISPSPRPQREQFED